LAVDLEPVRHPWRFALGNVFMAPAVRYLPKSLSTGRGMDRLGGGCFESKIWVRGSWGRGQGLGHGLGPTLPHNSLRNSRISTPPSHSQSGFSFCFFAPLFLFRALNVYRLFIIIIYLFALLNTHARSRNDTL